MKFLTFICLIISTLTFSQYDINVIELEKAKSRGASFQGIDSQGYIYATSFRSFNIILTVITTDWIKVINPVNRTIVTEQKVDKKGISDRGYRYKKVDFIEGRPVYIVTKKSDLEEKFYYAFEFDRTLRLLSEPYKIGKMSSCRGFLSSGSKSFTAGVEYYKNTKTGNRTFVSDITCSNDDELNFYAVKLNENNNVLFDFDFTLPLQGDIDKSNIYVAGNKIYFSIGVTTKEKVEGRLLRQNITTNYLFVIDEFGEVQEIDIELGNDQVASEASFSTGGNNVLVSGQIVNKRTNRLEGLFSASLDPDYAEFTNLEKHKFEEEFITRFWSKYEKRRAEKGKKDASLTPNFILVERYETDDGGAVFLYQKRVVRVVSRTSTSASGMVQYYSSTYYYYQDVIAAKMNKNGYIDWVELFPLDNVYIDFDPGPSFRTAQKDGDVYIIHSANEKLIDQINDSQSEEYSTGFQLMQSRNPYVAISKISTSGKVTCKKLDLNEDDIYYSARSTGVDNDENKFIMLSTPRKMFGVQKRTKIVEVSF